MELRVFPTELRMCRYQPRQPIFVHMSFLKKRLVPLFIIHVILSFLFHFILKRGCPETSWVPLLIIHFVLGCAMKINHPALGLPPLNYGNLQARRSGPFFAKLVNITQTTLVYSTEKKHGQVRLIGQSFTHLATAKPITNNPCLEIMMFGSLPSGIPLVN